MNHHNTKSIVIVSSCSEPWGGSEELWARSIPYYQKAGYKVVVMKYEIDFAHEKFVALKNNNVGLVQLKTSKSRLLRILHRNWKKIKKELFKKTIQKDIFEQALELAQPSLVIVSQGINFDGLGYGCISGRLGIPYVIVCQKAVDFYWPNNFDRRFMIESLLGAAQCFFVSNHNKRLTEEQFGITLSNSHVIFNPVKVKRSVLPYPSDSEEIKLACIGRLFLLDKGQDMLLRIFSQDKWRNRKVSISFFGTGVDKDGLVSMASFLDLDNVHFEGYTNDIEAIWKDHHALILASRSEGMPLVLLEAMAVGRIGIITNAGGNAEIVEDAATGFIGAVCQEGIEDALERAWQKKEHWAEMGHKASEYIKKVIPINPEEVFANATIKHIL